MKKYKVYGFAELAAGHDGAFPTTHCWKCGERFVVSREEEDVVQLRCKNRSHNSGSTASLTPFRGSAKREYEFENDRPLG